MLFYSLVSSDLLMIPESMLTQFVVALWLTTTNKYVDLLSSTTAEFNQRLFFLIDFQGLGSLKWSMNKLDRQGLLLSTRINFNPSLDK